jgi:serine/threonine protein phosphatase PrpC
MTVTTDSPVTLLVQAQSAIEFEGFHLQVKSYLRRVADVHYFRVEYSSNSENQNGLLRIGKFDGALSREVEVRKSLGTYKLVPDLLACAEMPVQVVLGDTLDVLAQKPEDSQQDPISDEVVPEIMATISIASEESGEAIPENLDEEVYLDEEHIEEDNSAQISIVALGELPSDEISLEYWLNQKHSSEQILSVIGLICQVFRYAQQRGWCFIQLFPSFVQVESSVKFLDLIGVYPDGEKLRYGLTEGYCAPEVAYSSQPIDEKVSTYLIGSLLYHAIHHKPIPPDAESFVIAPIPKIYQLLKTCLATVPEDRYPLAQLVSLIVETRQVLKTVQVEWEVAKRSTVGLVRSGNEDNYGVRQQRVGTSEPFLLGVVADGMGGEAHGEIASKLAVETLVEAPIPTDLSSADKKTTWLLELMQQANDAVSRNAQGGSTTLSAVLAIGRELAIAHVGDSRIFLLRNGCICQLSEDHSLPALLLASGQITYEESLTHPDKNQLTKFIGSKRSLSDGYVQDLSQFGGDKTLILEDGDILVLCSDGVWDLVHEDKLADIFASDRSLQTSVDQVIDLVLANGAHDNATVVAMKHSMQKEK